MKYIYLILIFLSFTHGNEFQKKYLNAEQIQFIKDHPTIIVSNETDWAPYDYSENGEPRGYSIEYIKLLAKKIGINIKFDTDTWSNIIKKVKNKEIDLIHPLSINEDRKTYLEFTKSILNYNRVIVANNPNLHIKNLNDLNGKTVAVAKNWNSTKILKENYPNMKFKDYEGSLEMLKAVAYGEADVTIDGFLTVNYLKQKHLLGNLNIVGRAQLPNLDQRLYIGVRKDWQTLKQIIDIAIDNITSEELVSLNSKWLIQNDNGIIFSKEESEFLEKYKKLSLCIDPDWFPYEEKKDNKHIGMSFDYFEEFRKSIPSTIEFLPTETWTQSMDFAKEGKCDILTLAVETPSRRDYLNFTKTYLDLPLVIATTPQKPFISNIQNVLEYKLGVIKSSYYPEDLRSKYPNIKLVELDSLKEGFEKVISGEIYGFIDTLTVVGYQVQNNYLGRVKISGKLNDNQSIGIAIRKDMPLLVSIFNKAIDNISEEKHREILNKWVSIKYENKSSFKYTYELLGLLSIIIIFVSYRQFILKKQNILLKESIDEFEHLLDSTIEAIFISQSNVCTNCNTEGLKLLGYENKDEIIGSNIFDSITDKYHQMVKENLKSDTPEPYEVEIKRKDGTIIPVLIRGKSFIRRNRRIRVAGIIDLSQLKNNEKLLIEQSKMAALGEMLENIAHQWRQPLSVISTAASGAKLQKEYGLLKDEQFNESMDGIIGNANYLSKTIDDFRNFILADKKKINFNLKKHIENDLSILYSMTHINNIEVFIDIDENIYLNSIESELTQVIINIINNSKDQFMKESIEDRYIFINASIKDEKVILSIKDNANGIDENIIDKIFEPYFTTKHKNLGTGLGLYMTNKLINESLNGTISAQNDIYEYQGNKYKGAKFNIELPLF